MAFDFSSRLSFSNCISPPEKVAALLALSCSLRGPREGGGPAAVGFDDSLDFFLDADGFRGHLW